MKKKIISVLSVVLVLCAIGAAIYFITKDDKNALAEPPVKYVQDILNNSACSEQVLLRKYASPDRSGAIYVIGTKRLCDSLLASFLNSESFDNIDGRPSPDGLKDFAGETICSVVNFSDFDGLNSSSDDSALRELAVRNVLVSIDTLCYASPYDPSGIGRKPSPKLIVLATPYVSAKGMYDVNTLLSACESRIPLMNPVELMVEDALGSNVKKSLNVGVVDAYNEGCYAKLLGPSASCVQYKSLSKDNPLVDFLDRYIADGNKNPLDVLMVNDPELDVDAMRNTVAGITSIMNEASLTYGNLLASDFRIIDARETVTAAAYALCRKQNLFTHYISQPRSLEFMVIPREKESRNLMFMQYNERFIPNN